jgi:4-hydroxy-3-methylbut-2-en-1-yl diphosphate synthase IspG/GcpE
MKVREIADTIGISKEHVGYTGCPTCYRTRHLFNNSNTNEDIATKFEEEYVRCVRNE